MNAALTLPILIPLFAAAISVVVWRRVAAQRRLAAVSATLHMLAGIWLFALASRGEILVSQIGDWPAPFGITLVADIFSAAMVLVTGVIGFATTVYSFGTIKRAREAHGYYPLVHILLAGVCGAFLTGDLFNLYVWFEVMLIASFVLLSLGGETPQLRGAVVYVTINLLSSAIFLAAVGLIYGIAGSLNMADLALQFAFEDTRPPLAETLGALLLITFGVKAALFPLFFWLPASYHTPPIAISALFAGLLTKVGVYALIRVFSLIFVNATSFTHNLLLWVAALTMLTGVMGAIIQNDMRRILSFHIISQIGYMVAGLGLFGLSDDPATRALALGAAIFYIIHHIIVKTNLFLVCGVVQRLRGSFDLARLGGVYAANPLIAMLFLIPALSLVGTPPLSGFFAKLSVIRAAVVGEQYVVVAIMLITSLLTLYSMTKIWAEAFWKAPPSDQAPIDVRPPIARVKWLRIGPIVLLAAITIAIGIFAESLFEISLAAGQQLTDRHLYVEAVLGAKP